MKKVIWLCLILWAPDGQSADNQSGAASAASDDERALIAVGKMTAWKLNPEAVTQGCEKDDPQRRAEFRAIHEQWAAANRDTLQQIDSAVREVLSRLGSSTAGDPVKANDVRALTRLRESFDTADAEQRTKICANLADFLAGLSQELKPMLDEARADVDKWSKSSASDGVQEHVISVPGEGWRIRFDAPKLTPAATSLPSVFFGRADRFQLVFSVDPPRCAGGDSDENIYECFTKALKENPIVEWDTERGNTLPNGILVMYMTKVERQGQVSRALNMHLLFARHGKWADVHGAFAAPQKDDPASLFAFIKSIQIEDETSQAK